MSNLPRSSAPAGTRDVPEVATGYCFLAKDTSDATLTVLVIKGDPGAPSVVQGTPARRRSGPGRRQYPEARTPPSGLA
eukprot:4453518-Alexandrium_andersonii.AAC.1